MGTLCAVERDTTPGSDEAVIPSILPQGYDQGPLLAREINHDSRFCSTSGN
jgi:hypothetical protein